MHTNDGAVQETRKQTQIWLCERCRGIGSVRSQEDVDRSMVLEALDRDHQEVSSGCSQPASRLQAINASLVTSRATLDADTTLPAWAKERLAWVFFGPKVGDAVSVPPARSDEYEGTVGTIASPVFFDPFDHTPVCLVRVPGYGPTIVFAHSDLQLHQGQPDTHAFHRREEAEKDATETGENHENIC